MDALHMQVEHKAIGEGLAYLAPLKQVQGNLQSVKA